MVNYMVAANNYMVAAFFKTLSVEEAMGWGVKLHVHHTYILISKLTEAYGSGARHSMFKERRYWEGVGPSA